MDKNKFGTLDLYNLQDCLEGYKRLINWLPALDTQEEILKEERLSIIDYLMRRCEDVMIDIQKREG